MSLSKEELAARRTDTGEYYLTVQCPGAIFRVYKPTTVNDLIEAAKKVQRLEASIPKDIEFVAFHKGFQIIGTIRGLGLPRGAVVEVKPEEIKYRIT